MIKTRHLLGPALLGLLLFTAGCPVDVNEGDGGGDDDGPATAECPKAQLATVRFFHGAGGTPVLRKDEFSPPITRNLTVVRPDVLDSKMAPLVVTSLAPGRASIVQLCGNKPIMLNARLAGASTDRITMSTTITLTPDADPSALDTQKTIILAGIADTLDAQGNPENPKSVADPLRIIVVDDTFSTGTDTQIQVVHISRKVTDGVVVEADPDRAGPDITTPVMRYTASAPTATKGTPDTAPISVPVAFIDLTTTPPTTRVSFTITPRIPATAKALAILFDTEVFDPDGPTPNPPTTARLFVTGDDPLLGRVAGGGVQF